MVSEVVMKLNETILLTTDQITTEQIEAIHAILKAETPTTVTRVVCVFQSDQVVEMDHLSLTDLTERYVRVPPVKKPYRAAYLNG